MALDGTRTKKGTGLCVSTTGAANVVALGGYGTWPRQPGPSNRPRRANRPGWAQRPWAIRRPALPDSFEAGLHSRYLVLVTPEVVALDREWTVSRRPVPREAAA
jgi:hypothetical protein